MAGTIRPDGVGKEGAWKVNDAKPMYGTGFTALFDSTRGTWNSGNVFYWGRNTDYLDITLNQNSKIWAIGNNGYANYNSALKVEIWNGSSWIFLMNTSTRVANFTIWDKVAELKKGRYRFSLVNSGNRVDDEWFIEQQPINKSLILNDGEYKKYVDDSYYLINETKINPIDNTYQRHYSMTQTSGNTIVSNRTDIIGTVNGDIEWQGKDGLKFNGTNNFVGFSGKILPIGAKSIFFQIKTTDSSPTIKTILSENSSANEHGMIIQINGAGGINVTSRKGIVGTTRFNMNSVKKINDGQWHNVLITWDGTINANGAKLYIDDLIVPDSTTTANATETVQGTYNTIIGKSATSNTLFINANIRNVEIYNSALVFNSLSYDSLYEYIESKYWEDISDTLPTSKQFTDQGMDILSPLLDRTITILEPTEMTQRNDILSSGEVGKVFNKTIDLKKYFDLRSIRTEVK